MRSRNTRPFWRICPQIPAEGPLYGIQVHMDLMDLYQSLKQDDAAQEQLDIAQKQISALDETRSRQTAVFASQSLHQDASQRSG